MATKRSATAIMRFLRAQSAVEGGNPDVPILSRRETLRLAMDSTRALDLTYTRKRDGATLGYVAHPYSIRGNKLYATESRHGHNHIHAFIRSRIGDIALRPEDEFAPVWPTEPESV